MNKLHDNLNEQDTAVLVGVGVNETITESSLDELSALCQTCNIIEHARIVQNRKDIDTTFYIGRGKVDEIKQILESEPKISVVVFDVELSGSKVRNLEKELGVTVLDRSKVILDIFAQRAQSAEGKLQVELAQLKYNLPRLAGVGAYLDKMRNSVGMRGPGERKLELDKRTIREQIYDLEQKIAKLTSNRNINKLTANKSGKSRVCIVGYTNSGKSTLHNAMSKSAVYVKDQLFATLDPKTVNVYIQPESDTYVQGVQILLTDTVGFINKLPHEFIKAFESTLDEAKHADLLLHVVDWSNPDYQKQIEVVNQVLAKIGASHVPTILVYNKADKVNHTKQNPKEIYISALNNVGIDLLKKEIVRILAYDKLK